MAVVKLAIIEGAKCLMSCIRLGKRSPLVESDWLEQSKDLRSIESPAASQMADDWISSR